MCRAVYTCKLLNFLNFFTQNKVLLNWSIVEIDYVYVTMTELKKRLYVKPKFLNFFYCKLRSGAISLCVLLLKILEQNLFIWLGPTYLSVLAFPQFLVRASMYNLRPRKVL
jgi:hypothetical protein